MEKSLNILKFIFHTLNLFIIVLYLYPGSILGLILYGNLKQQPQITIDFFNISSNHVYAFFLLSLLGSVCYLNHLKFIFLIYYLFFLSVILELFHIIIPERSFQFGDLAGNVLGVIISCIIVFIFKYWRKQ
tara:strand:+ start:512 stop:904 length:393 start_codon:yes stop_codon:yes gene_type:complete